MQRVNESLVADTVRRMIGEIGVLRRFVAIDQMPEKLQQARQLLRELDHELTQREIQRQKERHP